MYKFITKLYHFLNITSHGSILLDDPELRECNFNLDII